ncbi:MAG: phosphoadenosine phosphosulfate reductase family protein [Dysgonamonadaceae bacterium]|jgi:phosphoadenosine phosphosulfate reductase|nr:phosphoadenosine phosphosulfate reductase family protein [Dysgonamonadaceae bacterium]
MIDKLRIQNTLQKAQQLSEIYNCKLNLGFSGGKDSIVLKYFADLYDIDYVANFNNTQIEQNPHQIQFIKSNYPEVKIIHPDKEKSFFVLMKKHGLPSIFRRWCCEHLKHSNNKLTEYRINIMGVRGEESNNRMKRGAVSVFGNSKRAAKTYEKLKATFANTDSQIQCESGKDKVNIYPIFDLTENEIWDIIKSEKLVVPDAYKNKRRLGCAFCPFESFGRSLETIKDCPNLTKQWLKILSDREFQETKQKNIVGKTNGTGLFYLYITQSLLTTDRTNSALKYLNQKDLYGKTGLEKFEDYINNVLSN